MAIAKKKKRFWEVEMPLIKKSTQLYSFNIKDLNNKIIKYDLTRLLKGKSFMIQLKVQADSEKAISYPISLKLMPYFIKRMIRKNTNYAEDSFIADCKNAKIQIKPFMITRRKVSRKVKKAVREKSRQEIIDYIKNKKIEEIFDDILKNKLQKEISLKIKKVYPLSFFEIKMLNIKEFKENSEKTEKEENSLKKEGTSSKKENDLSKEKDALQKTE